ncbi:hypothetical protein QTP70_024105 [Hemibagrus guttatus]|uniref:Uncharacterized protein n=1 Tax=Hemibagrus guttatus TaxID=175788 RepID=A0AAE0QI04_9TELE|nr:hypothetical protein QTP70_024105 [Hemibagrus guttatus]
MAEENYKYRRMTSSRRRSCKNTQGLDHSSVEGDISSATSTLFLCLASAEPCIVQGLIPREISSGFWKY